MSKQKKTVEEPMPPVVVAAPPALRKFDLSGIAQKPASGKTAKEYPVLPDADGAVAELVASILEKAAQLEAVEGALEVEKAELVSLAKQYFFTSCSGKAAVPSAIEARAGAEKVRVGMSGTYRGTPDDAALLRVFGAHAERFVRQSFEMKIKGDLIPEAEVPGLIAELQEVFARHNAGPALSAKAVFKPTAEFHVARHTLFSLEQNTEIDKVLPMSASVRTKLSGGREEA